MTCQIGQSGVDVTHTNMLNPTICSNEKRHTSFSHPRPKLTIHIPNVRQVSIVLLVVALTRLVTLNPKKLKAPIENMMAKHDPSTVGVDMIWCHPRGISK